MTQADATHLQGQKKLFWACFIALVATSFAFIIRIFLLEDPGFRAEFNLSDTQAGEITGAGLWPFGISIILFSLIIDRVGYGKAIAFAFVCHTGFALLTIFASSYDHLYVAALLSGLAAGAIEAAINPIVATIFSKNKTKWLNILHAGWPAGFVIAGLISIAMGEVEWNTKVLLIFLPVVAYGAMMATCNFPVSERVTAGVSHHGMLKEVGFVTAFIAMALICNEIGRYFAVIGDKPWLVWGVAIAGSLAFGVYTKSIGRPIFIVLTIIMMPLAITELSVDNWITTLMKGDLKEAGANSLWVLVYTMSIMMTLRFCAGPIVHQLSPLGLLATSAFIAICGLAFLSVASGIYVVFLAGAVWALGKTFFWPTMLGVVSEQCPRGGAMTLNLVAGVGMLAFGIIGNPLLGFSLDTNTAARVQEKEPAIYKQLVGDEKRSLFGTYTPLDQEKRTDLKKATPAAAEKVTAIENETRKELLLTWTLFPLFMFVSYIGLIFYFRSRGGYKPVELVQQNE